MEKVLRGELEHAISWNVAFNAINTSLAQWTKPPRAHINNIESGPTLSAGMNNRME
jgi:hypothetical protein